jgi:hypothetical protein
MLKRMMLYGMKGMIFENRAVIEMNMIEGRGYAGSPDW